MVGVENRLWLEMPQIQEECSPSIDDDGRKGYVRCTRWELDGDVPWDWDDGSTETRSAYDEVFHTYYTSSWGKPANGPGLDGRNDLPAYQVTVTSRWRFLFRDSWWEWDGSAWVFRDTGWLPTGHTCESIVLEPLPVIEVQGIIE